MEYSPSWGPKLVKPPALDVSKMTRKAKEEYLSILEEYYRRLRSRQIYSMYPESGPLSRHNYKKHLKFLAVGSKYRERAAICANRVGKALKHGTGVATPNGYKNIEAIQVGDIVIAGDGTQTKVTGVYPQGVRKLLCFSFDLGEKIVCCEDHLWLYQHPKSRYPYQKHSGKPREINKRFGEWSVDSANNIREQVGDKPITIRRVVIPTCKPWELDKQELPIDPYILGILIGDGGLRTGICFTSKDDELVKEFGKLADESTSLVKTSSNQYDWKIALNGGKSHGKAREESANRNKTLNSIRELGLYGKKSEEKFIPAIYLRSSREDRFALLQGLLDTDGTIGKTGAVNFSTSSPLLANDVEFLVSSLGGKTRTVEKESYYKKDGQKIKCLNSFRVGIRINECPFRLGRKKERWAKRKNTSNRIVHSITDAGYDECTCIEVDHVSHTYVIDHGIVTHNSHGMSCYELTLHLMGEYPPWWEGRRFDHPVEAWASGTTNQKTKEIIQRELIGPMSDIGTGLIPGDKIVEIKKKASSVPDTVETIVVKHSSGGNSICGLKSYEQGRTAFEGTAQHVIVLDEECDEDIYNECLLRTMTTKGILMSTFTPLQGVSKVVNKFMRGNVPVDGEIEGRYLVTATWDDAPHLTEDDKRELWLSLPPHERDSRSKGIPSLGSGAIYPILESDLVIDDFVIPNHWRRGYALDVGWNFTACLWGSYDDAHKILYLDSCYKRGQAEPEVHAGAIRSRGGWMPGVIDPASRISGQKDGDKLLQMYRGLGLDLTTADNAVEAGIYKVWTMMSAGRIKIFRSLAALLEEFRGYHRDNKGKIVKENDHLMDCMRYLVMSGIDRMRTMPLEQFIDTLVLAGMKSPEAGQYDILRHGL